MGMSATDELRRLLDERGEYYGTAGNKTWWGRSIDAQTGKPINVFHNFAQPMGEDRLYVELQLATPERAIAATLGNDGVGRSKNGVDGRKTTTRNTKRTVYGNPRPVCEVCGYGIGDRRWHYCPKCGAEVVE